MARKPDTTPLSYTVSFKPRSREEYLAESEAAQWRCKQMSAWLINALNEAYKARANAQNQTA
jgi:hypothetical protein